MVVRFNGCFMSVGIFVNASISHCGDTVSVTLCIPFSVAAPGRLRYSYCIFLLLGELYVLVASRAPREVFIYLNWATCMKRNANETSDLNNLSLSSNSLALNLNEATL